MLWNREPAVIMGVVQAVLGMALAFGIELSQEQVGSIMAGTAAVMALVVRSQVVPIKDELRPGGEE